MSHEESFTFDHSAYWIGIDPVVPDADGAMESLGSSVAFAMALAIAMFSF